MKESPTSEKDKAEMKNVPYSSVGSLMYAMICIRPSIGYVAGAASLFLINPRKEHWTTVK